MAKERTCVNCEWFHAAFGGHCRRYPPVMTVVPSNLAGSMPKIQAVYPSVPGTEPGCGEFRPNAFIAGVMERSKAGSPSGSA